MQKNIADRSVLTYTSCVVGGIYAADAGWNIWLVSNALREKRQGGVCFAASLFLEVKADAGLHIHGKAGLFTVAAGVGEDGGTCLLYTSRCV